MTIFADVINFQYSEQEVDKDIKRLLASGRFNPMYADITFDFLQSEIQNCQNTVNDGNHHLTVFKQNTMNEEILQRKPNDINPILDRLEFNPTLREFWFNYFVAPTYGRQKEPPIAVLQNDDKKEIMIPYGCVTDAFYTIYTTIHELMHGIQNKYFVLDVLDEFYREHYNLLQQGKSRDEAKAIQLSKNPELEEDLYYDRCFTEMQANSAATCYMMLKAVESGDKKLIDAVEERLLNESASMSDALMNENLGLAYFEYPATKQIIKEVKQGKCAHLLNKEGLLNWQDLYNYTKDKIEEMGYSKNDMFKSLETAKLLKKIRMSCTDKEEFLQNVENQIPDMEYPHNKICTQFVDAQRSFVYDHSKDLHHFYHRLGNKNLREHVLENTTSQMIKSIEAYKKIYQIGKIVNRTLLERALERKRSRGERER